jgi:hypothetical protein
MIDGNGGVIKAKDGEATRTVDLEAGFVGGGALTLRSPLGDTLVFKREVLPLLALLLLTLSRNRL